MEKGIFPGLYKRIISKSPEFTYLFTPNQIELYFVHKEGGKLIATDIDGDSYSIEDPGWYGKNRNSVSKESIDCFDLIKLDEQNYEELKTDLLKTKERTSKLLQMLEVKKEPKEISESK